MPGPRAARLPAHDVAGPDPQTRLSRRGLRWALEGIVVGHLTVARVAEGLGVACNTANDAVLAEGKRVVIDDSAWFGNVLVIGKFGVTSRE